MPNHKTDIGGRRSSELLRKAERKIALLKNWQIHGVPVDDDGAHIFVPLNSTQFARWNDVSLLVERFSEANWRRKVKDDEWHADEKRKLKVDAAIVMSGLRNVLNIREEKEDSISKIRADKKALTEQNKALVSQLESLDYEIEKGLNEIQRLEVRLEESNAKVETLTLELARVRKPTLIRP